MSTQDQIRRVHEAPACDMPRSVRRFTAATSGSVAILAGLIAPVLVGALGLGVETSHWYMTQRKLQHAADVAAHAAAVRHRAGDTLAEMTAAATVVSTNSGFLPAQGTIAVNVPPTSGAFAGDPDAVEVRLVEDWGRWFTGLFADGAVPISGRAVARIQGGSGPACVLALSGTESGAVSAGGSTSVTLNGCNVASNSVAADAFDQSGSSAFSTGCVTTVGGITSSGGLTVSEPGCPLPYSPVVRDPYRDVAEPAIEGPCENRNVGQPNQTRTVTPDHPHSSGVMSRRYCNDLSVQGNVTFEPGLYIIDGGSFTINGGGATTTPPVINGTGVTFFITGGADVRLNGTVELHLSAPTSGPYSGLLFFGDRDDTGVSHVINGSAGSTLQGAIYMPAGDVSFSGASAGSGGCTQVVAYTVTMTGNSELSSDCAAAGTQTIFTNEPVALVE